MQSPSRIDNKAKRESYCDEKQSFDERS